MAAVEIFLFATMSKPALESFKLPIIWVLEALSVTGEAAGA
jgi:hypothetical protein